MDRGTLTPAEIYAGGFCVDDATRRAFDVDVEDAVVEDVQRAIDTARSQVAQFFDISLSGDEGPGFLRYACGGFYRVHRDVAPEWDERFPRRISVVVFLTTAGEECEGGALRLYNPDAVDIAPRAGMLVAFPSETPHEVLPVTAGVRDAIVDWFY
ncbi:MAG TPA: 2OG-Fe(II) oxygenase [Vicinamibacterales bacterium]|nr:2OG-Fe(II) oxygenase [Vicinamibacterales bacterium]